MFFETLLVISKNIMFFEDVIENILKEIVGCDSFFFFGCSNPRRQVITVLIDFSITILKDP